MNLKIIKIETIPIKRYLFVKVYTDTGIVGLGEAGNWGFIAATIEAIKKLGNFLIGQDPFRIEHHYQNMYRAMYFRGSILMSAISALEIALWDIKGKALGVPVYELLGGKTRNKVRAYCSRLSNFETNPKGIAAEIAELKGKGFTACKVWLPDSTMDQDGKREFYSKKVELATEKVRLTREAVGFDFDLILEAHRSMSVSESIEFAREVEKYRPMIFEDPIIPDNVDMMSYVANKINIPIATGERYINFYEFESLIRRRAAQYIRPDVCAVGGLNASKKIAAIAEANNILVVPHNPLGPVSTAVCIQLCACISNVGIMELPSFMLDGSEDKMVKEPIKIENGCFIVPDRVGIGIELSDDARQLFPAKDRSCNSSYLNFDGSVRDW